MAGGEKFRLAAIGADRNGEMAHDRLTLGELVYRVNEAAEAGVPMDAEVQYGYIPKYLCDGLYVEKRVDLTDKSFDYLRDRASSVRTDVSNEAWAEIRRRLEALGRPGDHDD